MTSKQIQCEICRNEYAVGYCKTCGYVGETCIDVHKTVKVFQTHIVRLNNNNEHSKVIKQDITEQRCKQHPAERTIFLCKIHDSMICGRCLHSGHLTCVHEIVDLLHEAASLDFEKVNKMKSALKEVRDESLRMKDKAERSKHRLKYKANRNVEECMISGKEIKQHVRDIIQGITKANDIDMSIYASIAQSCSEKSKWCDDQERKIDDCIDYNMAGHLYLIHNYFEKEVSDVSSHIKEIKHKHNFKGFDFKENNVILKCVFEDLEELFELFEFIEKEEDTRSDEETFKKVVMFPTKTIENRRQLPALLNQTKQALEISEKERRWCVQHYHTDSNDPHETIVQLIRQKMLDEKTDRAKSKQEEAVVKAQIKDSIKWIQPTGTVEINTSTERNPVINLVFTFPDSFQTSHHPSPGNLIKGGTFTGSLLYETEGKLLCSMLKAAFRRGVMFILGKKGQIFLDGVSLYDGSVYGRFGINLAYIQYVQSLKAELADKCITEADIDQEAKLEETFTVDGSQSR